MTRPRHADDAEARESAGPLFDLGKAREARDASMEQVERAAETWLDKVGPLIAELARRQPELTSDDVWKLAQSRGIDMPNEPRALGPAMANAARARLIERTDRTVNSERIANHSRPVRVWRSLLFKAPEVPA